MAWLARVLVVFSFLLAPAVKASDTDLDALGRALEASALEARSLLDDAGGMSLGLTDRNSDWLVTHEDAIKALGKMVQAAGEVATESDALAAFVQSDQPKLLADQHRRDEAIRHYLQIARDLEQTTALISPLVSGPALDLSSLITPADRYRADADRSLAAIRDLGELLAYQLRGNGEATPTIRFHLRQFLDRDNPPDLPYGLITHVLFLQETGGSSRNQAFFESLNDSTRQIEVSSEDEASLINLFAIPVLDRLEARMEAEAGAIAGGVTDPSVYDYERADQLLLRVCLSEAISLPDYCAGRSGQGPFLLTHERWLIGEEPVTAPLLVVDLSKVHQDAFGAFIRAVKEQVMLSDFSSGERLGTLRLRLLTIILDTAYGLDPIKSSIAEIVSLAGKK